MRWFVWGSPPKHRPRSSGACAQGKRGVALVQILRRDYLLFSYLSTLALALPVPLILRNFKTQEQKLLQQGTLNRCYPPSVIVVRCWTKERAWQKRDQIPLRRWVWPIDWTKINLQLDSPSSFLFWVARGTNQVPLLPLCPSATQWFRKTCVFLLMKTHQIKGDTTIQALSH